MRFAMTFVLLLFSFSSLPGVAQVQFQFQWGRPRPPRSGACFYKDTNFRGDYFCLKPGDNWSSMPAGFNDRISSIRVFHDARVRIFNNDNFQGTNIRIDRNVDTLRRLRLRDNPRKDWNDRISSIAVYRDRDEWDRRHP